MLCLFSTVVVLLLIFYEDMKSRTVRLFLFVLLSILLFYSSYNGKNLYTLLINIIFNVLYIILITSFGYLYTVLKKSGVSFFSSIGLGDILLLLCLSVWFEPITFIVFNTVSLILALVIHLSLKQAIASYSQFETVPLAGYQSLCFSFLLVFTFFNS